MYSALTEQGSLMRRQVSFQNLNCLFVRTLRQPGRGRYDSERHLGRWLTSDGHSWTTADLSPARWLFLRLPSAFYGLLRLLRALLHGLVGLPVMLSCGPQRTSPTRHG